MISRAGNRNFFVAHYDWLALGVGVVALAVGAAFFVLSLGDEPEAAALAEAERIERMRPANADKPENLGVKPVDMTQLDAAMRLTRSPVAVVEISEKDASFLASERRVVCKKCKKAIMGDIKACPACPFCGEKQEEERKTVLDADADGLPDEWEKRYGLNPGDPSDANADTDGDGFTNAEEFAAKTDPTNRNDHPDYLDSLKIQLPLKNTFMPFIFTQAVKIPTGWRCQFFFPNRKDNSGYNRKGLSLTAVIGEEIGDSGFVLKGYEKKEEKRAIKGGQGMKKTVDVSEVTVVRKSDGKSVKLVLAESKSVKPVAVDVQATLVYTRGTVTNLEVVPGSEIDLNGTKYRVVNVKAIGKGAQVTVENSLSMKKHTLQALE